MIGRRLGNFEITELIGQGGMGAVYGARHIRLGHSVAIKMLRPELGERRDIIDRFFIEAKAAADLHHPGIVQVQDFDQAADGAAFIVMERLIGESLRGRLAREERLPLTRVQEIVDELADVLDLAHGKGIVHRDLKPDNIFLARESATSTRERVKVLDFGIAKLMHQTGPTQTGAILGTPHYLSPEQCSDATTVDPRSDVYALGCVVYEMLSGRPPFDFQTLPELIGAHLYQEAPPISTRIEGLPSHVERALARALAKKPAGRPAGVKAFARALRGEEIAETAIAGSGQSTAAAPVRSRTDDAPVTPATPNRFRADDAVAATEAPTPVPAPASSPVAAPASSPVAAPASSPVAAPASSPVPAPTPSPVPAPTPSPVPIAPASPVPSPVPVAPAAPSRVLTLIKRVFVGALAVLVIAVILKKRSQRGPTPDDTEPRITKMWEPTFQSCADGDAAACTRLARAFNGLQLADDPGARLKYAELGCTGGDGEGCMVKGIAYADGKGVTKPDPLIAFEAFQKSCELGHGNGCHAVGVHYESGDAGVKDLKLALVNFQRGCTLKHPSSCAVTGIMMLKDQGATAEVKQHLQFGCDGDVAVACMQLSEIERDGGDDGRARSFRQRACRIDGKFCP